MAVGNAVRDLLRALQPDEWRKGHPFSEDVQRTNDVLLHPYATEPEKLKALRLWLQPNQPCLFGRIAAATQRMHLCVLSDDDLMSSDRHIRGKIKRERLLWKIGSLRNERPEHGFMLLVASQRVALAAPDQNLLRFAHRIRDLAWDDTETDEYGNDLTWETLYLQNPADESYLRFKFSVDYFGAQGDGRWWHDHRVPGGIAFTANSVGHMAKTREWYEGRGPQTEWVVKVAMETVALGANTVWGKSIWLEDLEGRPKRGTACPFRDPGDLKESLRGKDWSYYAGYLSTDHSIREEFFLPAAEPPKGTNRRWLLDLLYLYDASAHDHARFVAGEPVTGKDIYAELGSPDTWRVGPVTKAVRGAKRVAWDPQIGSMLKKTWRLTRVAERRAGREAVQTTLATMRRLYSLEREALDALSARSPATP